MYRRLATGNIRTHWPARAGLRSGRLCTGGMQTSTGQLASYIIYSAFHSKPRKTRVLRTRTSSMACRTSSCAVLFLVAMVMVVPLGDAYTPGVIRGVVEDGRVMTPSHPRYTISKECDKALAYLFNQSSPATLKLYVLDAMGKPPAGIFAGNERWLGHYDECRSIPDYQYCATFLTVDLASLNIPANLSVTWGVCVPQECSEADIQSALDLILENTGSPVRPVTNESAVSCAYQDHAPFDAGFIGTMLLFSVIFLLMLLGTAYDWLLGYRRKKATSLNVYSQISTNNSVRNDKASEPIDDAAPETNSSDTTNILLMPAPPKPAIWEEFLLSFAINRNLVQLLSTKTADRGITCLNGLRVLSMFWVILGHAFFFPMEMGVTGNILEGLSWYHNFFFQVITNAFFSVDSFFFLSGLLLSYITLKKMAKRNGRIPWGWFYFHRYWRLTPAVLATTLIWMYIKPYLGDGPTWKSFQNIDTCINYWWTNILYINNFYPTSFFKECIGWVWYLANDMQFFIISPVILVPLYFLPVLGLCLIGMLMIASFVITGVLVGVHHVGPNGMNISGYPAVTVDYSSLIYSKPYCRIPPYLVGMLLGYLMHRQGDRKIHLNPAVAAVGWAIASAVGMSVVYGLKSGEITMAGAILYEMLSRFAWAVALSWVVFACNEGYGGWVNDILSWRAWLPLSRVTFSAYLLHPIVIYIFLGNFKGPMMVSLWLQPTYFVAYMVMAYAAAFLMALFIELPFANLEKIMMPSK